MASEETSTLASVIKDARLRAGLSIRQVAPQVGVHHSVLARIEAGDVTRSSPRLVQAIADVLDLDSVVLLGFLGVRLPDTVTFLRHRYHLDPDQASTIATQVEALVVEATGSHRTNARKETAP